MTDEWMQERTQAPLDKMKDWVADGVAPLVNMAKERIGIVQAGKRMLDDGGEAAELGVLAKKVSIDAVKLDNDIMIKLGNVVRLYSEAAELLQDQTSGLGFLGSLAEAYAKRSQVYSAFLETLEDAPQEPPTTDVEQDAMKILQLRQAKAGLGLREQVGGPKAGRHGSSLFKCVERDTRPQGKIANSMVHRAQGTPERCPEDVPLPTAMLTSPTTDWRNCAGDNGYAHAYSSNPPHVSEKQKAAWSFDESSSNASMPNSTGFGKRPAGASMASKVELMTKLDEEAEIIQNSGTVQRTDTLDTVNTCLKSLDNLRTVIDTVDAPIDSQSQHAQSMIYDNATVSYSTGGHGLDNVHGSTPEPRSRSVTPSRRSPTASFEVSGREPPSTVAHIQEPIIPSTTSYVVGGPANQLPQASSGIPTPSSRPAEGCRYKVGDPVEILSKSAETWVRGSVVDVDGFVLTVQYGDRERKVDLKSRSHSSIIRTLKPRDERTGMVIDSMLTNPGDCGPSNVHYTQSSSGQNTITRHPVKAPPEQYMASSAPPMAGTLHGVPESSASLESPRPMRIKAAVL